MEAHITNPNFFLDLKFGVGDLVRAIRGLPMTRHHIHISYFSIT